MTLRLTTGVTAVTAAPTLATDGVALRGYQPGGIGFWQKVWDSGVLHLKGASTGANTYQGILYLWDVSSQVWAPAGMAVVSDNRGLLNDGNTLTGTTTLGHTQPINGLSGYDRIALRTTVISGTGMAVDAWLSPRYVV